MKFLFAIFPLFILVPLVAFAQGDFIGLSSLLRNITAFINGTLVPFIFTIAFLVFIWGVVQYFILGSEDDEKRKGAKQLMLWGIIGFVLMVSVWGIVNLLAGGLGLADEEIESIPSGPIRN